MGSSRKADMQRGREEGGRLSPTVVPAKSDSDVMFCLQSYHELRIDRSLVY